MIGRWMPDEDRPDDAEVQETCQRLRRCIVPMKIKAAQCLDAGDMESHDRCMAEYRRLIRMIEAMGETP